MLIKENEATAKLWRTKYNFKQKFTFNISYQHSDYLNCFLFYAVLHPSDGLTPRSQSSLLPRRWACPTEAPQRPHRAALLLPPLGVLPRGAMCEFMLPLQADSKLEDKRSGLSLSGLDWALPAGILQRRWVDSIQPALLRPSLCSQCGPWERP